VRRQAGGPRGGAGRQTQRLEPPVDPIVENIRIRLASAHAVRLPHPRWKNHAIN
jgi:hypothetical protein